MLKEFNIWVRTASLLYSSKTLLNLKMRNYFIIVFLLFSTFSIAQDKTLRNNQTVDGYKGIWFTLGQFSEFGDKYSGGLGTYTAKHIPLSIYSPEVNKTFFVYGGTTGPHDRYLLCMIGSYDHITKKVSKPTVVHDKQGVDDPHDNPSLAIDSGGYIWVFISGRGKNRMGFKYKSTKPFSTEALEQITEEEMTYPQPFFTCSPNILACGNCTLKLVRMG